MYKRQLAVGGITGAAVVWTLRTVSDALAMFWLAHRLQLLTLSVNARGTLLAGGALVTLVAAAAVLLEGGAFVALVAVAMSFAAFMSVRIALELLGAPASRRE